MTRAQEAGLRVTEDPTDDIARLILTMGSRVRRRLPCGVPTLQPWRPETSCELPFP
jgi:hypothetical protein